MATTLAKVFVYGTLRRGFPLHYHLEQSAPRFLGKGTIQARLYDLGEFPGALLSGNSADTVNGELYELTCAEEELRALDEVEEYDPERPEQSIFIRRTVEVQLEDGKRTEAWAYFLPGEPTRARPIPSGDYEEVRRSRN